MRSFIQTLAVVVASAVPFTVSRADDKPAPKTELSDPVTRLFFQDHKTGSLMWADVREGSDKKLHLDTPAVVDGFPKLDAKQKLVQMRESSSLLCVGVRDDNDGGTQGGWVLVQTGAGYADHGDHGHWTYKKPPAVLDTRLDKEQGNPAHLYLYGGKFFVARHPAVHHRRWRAHDPGGGGRHGGVRVLDRRRRTEHGTGGRDLDRRQR
jgi:hypothetical protein